jgi:enamine deaminase RidA (YjgF/YER057c/UK114 family)
MVDASTCATVVRPFAGPLGDELAVLCCPDGGSPDTVRQAAAAYGALAALLATQRASFRDLTRETLFLRDIVRDLPLVLDARRRILADLGQSACAPLPAFIQQAPVDQGARFELAASAAVPRHRDVWSLRDVRATPSCVCEGCARSGARLLRLQATRTLQPVAARPSPEPRRKSGAASPMGRRPQALGDQTSLYTTNIYGAGADAFAQAWDMFCAAERLLDQCGMGFRDVVRTWIYLRDIDRDYDALNKARREFFRRRGIELRPASTGVQGMPFPGAHDFSMSVYAVKASPPLDVTPVSAPTLNEAWSYGADFSRSLRIAEANKVAIYVSGTASIDEAGRTVHVGNFEAQVERMLDNIASLLAQQGASFEDVVSGVTYLRNPSDAPVLRAICHQRGFDGFPCALVEASLCRPELLCETEAVAMLPLV